MPRSVIEFFGGDYVWRMNLQATLMGLLPFIAPLIVVIFLLVRWYLQDRRARLWSGKDKKNKNKG